MKDFKDLVLPHFSVRKLTIGTMSVMFGVFMWSVANGQVAYADTNEAKSEVNETVTSQINDASEIVKMATSSPEEHKAIVNDKNNTSKTDKRVDNNDNSITNVKGDGSVGYDVNVTAKDKTSGKTVTADMGSDLRKNNKAYLDPDNQDIAAHLKLTNHGESKLQIGNPANHKNDDGANLFINTWNDVDHTLKIAQDQPAIITVTDSTGKVIENSDLKVYYSIGNLWLTYDEITNKSLISQSRKVGLKGTLGAGLTADLSVPLVYDASAANQSYGPRNEISVQTGTYNTSLITITTAADEKIWSKDEIRDDYLHPVFRGDDDNYYEIPDEDEISALLPKAGEVLTIIDSGSIFDTSGQVLYKGGKYQIALEQIQKILGQHGYAVNIVRDGSDLMNNYTYHTKSLDTPVKTSDGSKNATDSKSHQYFYIEVHKIVNAKDQTFEEGSSEAANWDVNQNVDSVYDMTYKAESHDGFTINNVLGDKTKAKLISIKDDDGHLISRIDANTPAGTYCVTVGYAINGSDKADMLITNTAKVVITPKAFTPPSDQPTVPTNPANPSTPVEPSRPTEPSNPTQPSEVPPHADQPTKPQEPHKPAKPSKGRKQRRQSVQPHGQLIANIKSQRLQAVNEASPAYGTGININTTPQGMNNQAKQNNSLPQTGEKQKNTGLIGLVLVAVASLFGFATDKRKEQ